MNTFSHLLMGRLLREALFAKQGILLQKESFLWGNILPDFSPSFLKRPHYLENNRALFKEKIERLYFTGEKSRHLGKDASRDLGIICHFACDFFCFAHTGRFPRDLTKHVMYERNFHRYFVRESEQTKNAVFSAPVQQIFGAGGLEDRFFTLQREYLSAPPSYGRDGFYSSQFCLEALISITASFVFDENSETGAAFSVSAA